MQRVIREMMASQGSSSLLQEFFSISLEVVKHVTDTDYCKCDLLHFKVAYLSP